MKELQTHNLPEIGGLFFSSTYNKGFKDYVRILTQLFTFSKYDHCATLIQCPMELNGKMVKDYQGKVVQKNNIPMQWKGGEYYVFEALVGLGNIVRTFDEFLENLQSPIHKRSLTLHLQEYKELNDDGTFNIYIPNGENLKKAFLDISSQLGKPYTSIWAGFSAFDKISFIQWLNKKCGIRIKPPIKKANFCSVSMRINIQVYMNEVITKNEAMLMSPEEVRIENIQIRKFSLEKSILEIKNGIPIASDIKYITIK